MSEENKKRVVIAGATGYLGKYAVKAFKERGYWVRVLNAKPGALARSWALYSASTQRRRHG